MLTHIQVRGAREHNLKGVDVDLPKNSLTVITGLSGSGKSSLAFDTIYAEGQRRYLESLSAHARLGRHRRTCRCRTCRTCRTCHCHRRCWRGCHRWTACPCSPRRGPHL
jgi:putative ribosome biogenesis GTPase RsgA